MMNQPIIYSFDIFDTCITRRFYKPIDLFLELATQILERHSQEASDKTIKRLANERIKAEALARRETAHEDITIEDIYRALSLPRETKIPLQEMLALELTLERSNTLPITATLKKYKALKAAGESVIFISDIYLPKDTVLSMLSDCGYQTSAEKVYLSGEIGLRKRTANLYSYVAQEEHAAANSIHHYGDNYHSDVRMAHRAGLTASHLCPLGEGSTYENIFQGQSGIITSLSDTLQRLSRFYRRYYVAPNSRLSAKKQIALSRVSAASRYLVRNSPLVSDENRVAASLGYFIAGPLFNSFVHWMLNKANEQGIKRLYFVARNGQIFKRVAEEINSRLGLEIELHYLFGSRTAWYPASFVHFDDKVIDTLLSKYPEMTVREILNDLAVRKSDIEDIVVFLEVRNSDVARATDRTEVGRLLLEIKNSSMSAILEKHFEYTRRLLTDYLDQEEFFKDPCSAIVDIGWHLSAHNALQKSIQNHPHGRFHGFYFGVGRTHARVTDSAPFFSFFSDEHSRELSWLFKLGAMQLLEETFASANHGTTIGYQRVGNTVEPILSTRSYVEQSPAARKIERAILDFTDFVLSIGNCPDFSTIQAECISQLERLYNFPTADEANSISETPIFALASHTSDQQRVLSKRLTLKELIAIGIEVLKNGRNIRPKWLWLQGSMQMSSYPVSLIGKILSRLELTIVRNRN